MGFVNPYVKPDWDNPYLRDRCREFLEQQSWGRRRDEPYDVDTDRLVDFVVKELSRADEARLG
jgi:hypothetical protein